MRSYGVDTAPDWSVIAKKGGAIRREAREIAGALARLIKQYDHGIDEHSPRIDGTRLVSEIAARRLALSRCVRRELGTGLVLLAADVSSSCSATCAATLTAAWSVACELPHAVVVRHSNGDVIDVVGRPATGLKIQAETRLLDVVQMLDTPVVCTVAWGDWDAGHDYRALAGDGDLYWLDSYCATSGPRPASCNLRAAAATWPRQPRGWWQGVNTAAATSIALRAMARQPTPGESR